ncbi:uncharacterized protein KQ657_002040 [Scheffersomyces spartinae]|uniref:ERCC4 domain-containing protein n=1 Tax=Scheffersomyces spartinae TaxID=45513 RepID=A0A9P7V7H2_9ASCO|nr:uncharacterized protein KQ657_002040 [Scheffersomyces spartinae]KAG7192321.1 hypothetical protein KQ657_002040 [Scheffersomyces spartinae]
MSLFVEDEDVYEDAVHQEQEIDRLFEHQETSREPSQFSVNIRSSTDANDEGIPLTFIPPETIPEFEAREVSCNLPLSFQQLIVEDLMSRDGLLVLGRGLGWDSIAANLLHGLSFPTVTLQNGNVRRTKRSLIVVLGANETEFVRLREELYELLWIDDLEGETPVVSIGGGGASSDGLLNHKRKQIYANGGIVVMTARIMAVDLLSGSLDANDITGLLLLHAERVRETSSEAFVVSLFRDKNDWGFIKAISDEPESITGFTPLATKLKLLRLKHVLLWPRFHVEVSASLNALKVKQLLNRQKKELERRRTVTEINTRMSSRMVKIQNAVLACINECLQELKRHNTELATDYWSMDNVHDPDFVTRIRYNLDVQWHRLTFTSKQLIFDLVTLTDMLRKLISLDSVSFYEFVQGILDTNIRHASTNSMAPVNMSPWLSLPESNIIISNAKDRALGKIKRTRRRIVENLEDPEESMVETVDVEEYYLEELPKWEQLLQLLDDISHEKMVLTNKNKGPILIVCSSDTVKQLSTLITSAKLIEDTTTNRKHFSFKLYMASKLKDYLFWKEISKRTKLANQEIFKAEDNAQNIDNNDSNFESNINASQIITSKSFSNALEQPTSKRRRTRGGASTARVQKLYSASERTTEAAELDTAIIEQLDKDLKDDKVEEVEPESNEFYHVMESKNDLEIDGGGFINDNNEDEASTNESLLKALKDSLLEELSFEMIKSDTEIIIQSYDDRDGDSLLQALEPSYIIMYEPDLSFIRRVEAYQAINEEHPAKTYFMYYGNSVEEQKHLLRIKKEKDAFTRLIREKSELGEHFETDLDRNRFRITRKQVVNTRIAGGANFRTETDEFKVVVDTREFLSSLPSLLYRVGITVAPCMLTVGDYILTPKICVERKSIPDLVSSLRSGRLYQQCEQMFRYYELPTLLIEFDENKAFSFEPFTDSRFQRVNAMNPTYNLILQQNIQSQIMSLLVSFPKLKVIWSSSPYETAQIFLSLKANQEEPDVGTALDMGVNKALKTEDGGPPQYNDEAIDFLQTIPGVNKANYTLIINRMRNVEALVKLTKPEFEQLLGEENGRKAYNFINHKIA